MNLDIWQSVYREQLLEHLFIGALLKHSWLHRGAELEVSRPSIDRAGHDLVLEANGITRHIQLKTSSIVAKTASQKIHVGLAAKPSGCVVWVRFDANTLELGPFHYFGDAPGMPLPALAPFRVAKHTKGNAQGLKQERPNLRVIPRSKFKSIQSVAQLYSVLFG